MSVLQSPNIRLILILSVFLLIEFGMYNLFDQLYAFQHGEAHKKNETPDPFGRLYLALNVAQENWKKALFLLQFFGSTHSKNINSIRLVSILLDSFNPNTFCPSKFMKEALQQKKAETDEDEDFRDELELPFIRPRPKYTY